MELIRLGEREGAATERLERIAAVWREAGFNVRTYDDVGPLVWEKLICNVCFSGTCAILDRTIGEVLGEASAWAVASQCASEAYQVARALRIDLSFEDPVEYARAFGLRIPQARPSVLLDLTAGRRCEIDVINGAVPRVGRSVGVAAPVNQTVTALVKALEAGGSRRG
jgi:2-dehydropantoate 2-reductase